MSRFAGLAVSASSNRYPRVQIITNDGATMAAAELGALLGCCSTVRIVLIGHIVQSKIFVSARELERCSVPQLKTSVLEQLLGAGHIPVCLTEQKRICHQINDHIISPILCHFGIISIYDERSMNRNAVMGVVAVNKQELGIETDALQIDAPWSKSQKIVGHSHFSEQEVTVAALLLKKLILFGFTPSDIMVTTPYIAQRDLYVRIQAIFEEELPNHD